MIPARTSAATTLLAALQAEIPRLQAHAAALDAAAEFPAHDMARLAALGMLTAPLPDAFGGLGAGTEPHAAALIRDMLVALGRGNPAVARLFEAHVNAIRLIMEYGGPAQRRRAAEDARAGHLFGLWVTDPPGAPKLRLEAGVLHGAKGPCSGAAHCTRALVTAETGSGTVMVLAVLRGGETVQKVRGLLGMRAAANGTVTLTGLPAPDGAVIGVPGDYLREPDFSTGAWRGSAAALGVLDALVAEMARMLRARGQQHAPLQLARFGRILIAQETARLFVAQAAGTAEAAGGDAAAKVARVNLARIAVETACLDALRDIQRGLGLAVFVAPHPVERMARDLATYLRQPAPDEVLTEGARHFLEGPA